MEIKVLSLGNPQEGYKNYFAHGECYDEYFLNAQLQNESLPAALRLDEWQDYNGTNPKDCVLCGQKIEPPDQAA